MSDLRVPEALEESFRHWDDAGRPPQSGIAWPLGSWETTFPEHVAFLASLPNPLDRGGVKLACASASASSKGAIQGFIAAMIWGYGRVGYGPFRAARVPTTNPNSATNLQEAAETCRQYCCSSQHVFRSPPEKTAFRQRSPRVIMHEIWNGCPSPFV